MRQGYRTDERRTLLLWAYKRHWTGVTVREMARRFRVSTSVITHDLEALGAQGYLTANGRKHCPRRWSITPAGERALRDHATVPTRRTDWPRRAPPQEEAAA